MMTRLRSKIEMGPKKTKVGEEFNSLVATRAELVWAEEVELEALDIVYGYSSVRAFCKDDEELGKVNEIVTESQAIADSCNELILDLEYMIKEELKAEEKIAC